MECWHCNEDLIWGGDQDDEKEDGTERIITNLSCSNDECDTIYSDRDWETFHFFNLFS